MIEEVKSQAREGGEWVERGWFPRGKSGVIILLAEEGMQSEL